MQGVDKSNRSDATPVSVSIAGMIQEVTDVNKDSQPDEPVLENEEEYPLSPLSGGLQSPDQDPYAYLSSEISLDPPSDDVPTYVSKVKFNHYAAVVTLCTVTSVGSRFRREFA